MESAQVRRHGHFLTWQELFSSGYDIINIDKIGGTKEITLFWRIPLDIDV